MGNHTPEPCNGCVPAKSDDVRARYCKRPGTCFENGRWYCKQHAPSVADARKKAADDAWERRMEEHRRTQQERADARARGQRCIAIMRGLDIEKVAALLDAVRCVASSEVGSEQYGHGLSLESKATTDLEDSIRAGGGQ